MAINLLSTTSRVEIPFIKVTIGEYTFGGYDKKVTGSNIDVNGVYKLQNIKYPNYIQSLNVVKINGTVNKYTLTLTYPITPNSDPNFFEKVFGSVSNTRKIIFSYGDLSVPTFLYKEEEALILKVNPQFDLSNSRITYTVTAQSSSTLINTASYLFPEVVSQPSKVIENLLTDTDRGLLEIFYGMKNIALVKSSNLIPHDDATVTLMCKKCTVLEYLNYLVSCMRPANTSSENLLLGSKYYFIVHDDFSSKFGGPYFQIERTDKDKDVIDAYEIELGYPTAQVVMSFSIESDDEYALFYNYANKLNNGEFVQQIDDEGNLIKVYAPVIASNNAEHKARENDKTWWTNVTEFPIKARIVLKGLLRSAQLMSYVRLNVRFYGKKHTSSGLYIITQQLDEINTNTGFKTTLSLVRVKGDLD